MGEGVSGNGVWRVSGRNEDCWVWGRGGDVEERMLRKHKTRDSYLYVRKRASVHVYLLLMLRSWILMLIRARALSCACASCMRA